MRQHTILLVFSWSSNGLLRKEKGQTGMPNDAKTATDSLLMPGEKPTLKTIARITGLAVPTVSRALNDAPDIKQQTKVLVRKIAEQIGYVPNRAGVRLRTGKTNVISLVLAAKSEVMNHNAKLIASVAKGLQGTNYHLNITPFFEEDDIMKPIRYIVETASADCVIFNQTSARDPRISYLRERNFPFVTHGRSDWADEHAWADYDNQAFGQIAAKKLVARGRKNILMLAPPMHQAYAEHMVLGAQNAAEAAGLKLRFTGEVTSDSSHESISTTVRRMLAADPDIDGVICGSMLAAIGAVAAAEFRGHTIGQSFDIVAKEALPFLGLFRPGIIAVSEDITRAGDFLAKAAIASIRDPSAPPMQDLEVPV